MEDWEWERGYYCPPDLTHEQEAMLTVAIREVQEASPLSSDIKGGRSWVWRYMEGAQWRQEPVRGKRVSSFFVDTLEWRQRGNVDSVLDRALSFVDEAGSGKFFVRGRCRLGRPLIWVHLGRENNASDPQANISYLIYTVVSLAQRVTRTRRGHDLQASGLLIIQRLRNSTPVASANSQTAKQEESRIQGCGHVQSLWRGSWERQTA